MNCINYLLVQIYNKHQFDMSRKLAIPEKQITIAITELTEQLLAQKQIKDLIANQCSYQIISGYLESSSYMFVDRMLLTLLPLSKDRLIDICLPYLYSNYDSATAKTLARYIIFDNKLRGIRVCSGNDWRMKRCEYLPPPISVQRYYAQNKIPFEMDEMLVGSFYLQFPRCKIGLLFQSEIIDNGNLLSIYNRYNFNVLSITGNIIKHTKDNASVKIGLKQKELTSKLKTIARDTSVTVLYAGIKIAPTPTSYYFNRSYKIQGDEMVNQPKTCLGQQSTLILVCKLAQPQLRNMSRQTQEDDEIDQVYQLINKLQISKTIFSASNIAPNERTAQRNDKKYMNQNLSDIEVQLLHLWLIFKTVNQDSPFVIPFPFSQKSLFLFNNLIKLDNYCLLSLESLVQIYRYKQGETSFLKVKAFDDFNHLLSEKSSMFPKFIYVYTNDEEQITNLRSHPKYGQRICDCNLINPIVIVERNNVEDNGEKFSLDRLKKMQDACSRVIRQRHQSVEDILNYFKSIGLSYSQIEYSFIEMFLKMIKKNVKLIPLYIFLLRSSKEEIIAQIKQAQQRIITNQQKVIVELDEINMPYSSISQPSYKQKVEETKAYKHRLSKGSRCHTCQFLLNKKYLRNCPDCKESICFECIDNSTNHTLTKINQYRCIVCTKRCTCHKCLPQISAKPIQERSLNGLEPKKTDIFDDKNFWCSYCQLFQKDKSISLQCIQCKKLVCFSCNRQPLVHHQNILSPQQTNYQLCKQCRNPKREKQLPRIRMTQMQIQNDLLPVSMDKMDIQKDKQENQRLETEKDLSIEKGQKLDEKKEQIEVQKNDNRKAEKSPRKKHKKSSSKSKHKLHHKKKKSKKSRRSSSSSQRLSSQSSRSKNQRHHLRSRSISRSRDKSPQKIKKKPSTEMKQPQILHKISSERKKSPQKVDKAKQSTQKATQQKLVQLKSQKQAIEAQKIPIKQQKPQKSLWGNKQRPDQQKSSHNINPLPKQQNPSHKAKQQAFQSKNETKNTPKPDKVLKSKKLLQVSSQSSYEEHSY